jgi:putative DNA primase/helicase
MNNNELSDEVDILSFDIIGLASHLLRGADDTPVDPAVTKSILELFRNTARQLEAESDAELQLPQLVLDLPADVTAVDVADSVVALSGSNIRFNPETQAWLVFDPETGWKWDPLCHRVYGLVVEALRELSVIEPIGLDKTQERRFTKIRRSRARRMQNIGVIRGIANLVSMNSLIYCSSSEIDIDTKIIGTPSGTVDLRSGEWKPYEIDQLITRRTPFSLVSNAQCERWERFLREVLGGDEEIQDYFHQLVGYLMSGETSLQQMWMFVGNGSNGKSTLLKILQKVLGPEYAQQAPESVLMGRANPGGASPDLARLNGVRMALLSETGYGQSFNEERLKGLVAADTTTARPLYRDFEEFTPQAKFLLATNHLPVVRGTDTGIWRRLVVVPFNMEFEVGSDPTLYQDLVAELPGIFAWAVRGAVRWYDSNVDFIVPSAWTLATNQYRSEHDAIQGFLDEHVVLDKAAFVGATELYNEYLVWCHADGRQALSQSEFGQRMMASGLVTKQRKFKANRYHYIGVALRPVARADEGVRMDGLFDDHSTTPPCPDFFSQDGLLTEVNP